MNDSQRVCIILPASGVGERMAISEPKQFAIVRGKPLICHTVDAFLRYSLVEKVIVTSPINSVASVREILKQSMQRNSPKIIVTEGGKTRHRSIKIAIETLKSDGATSEVIVIHDAVRPIVPLDILIKIISSAYTYGSAGVTRPLVSTVISKDKDDFLTKSLERSIYFNSEMPQAFKFELISEVYDKRIIREYKLNFLCVVNKCSEDDLEFGTECLQLVLKYANVRAKLIEGSPELWKVTYKKDLYALEGILAEQEIVQVIDCKNKNVIKLLQNIIPMYFKEITFVQEITCVNCIKFYKDDDSLENVLDNFMNGLKNERQIHIIHDQNPNQRLNLRQLKLKVKKCAVKNSPALINFICVLNNKAEEQEQEQEQEETELVDLILSLLRNNLTGQLFYL